MLFNQAIGYDMNAMVRRRGDTLCHRHHEYVCDFDFRSLREAHFSWAVDTMSRFIVEVARSGARNALCHFASLIESGPSESRCRLGERLPIRVEVSMKRAALGSSGTNLEDCLERTITLVMRDISPLSIATSGSRMRGPEPSPDGWSAWSRRSASGSTGTGGQPGEPSGQGLAHLVQWRDILVLMQAETSSPELSRLPRSPSASALDGVSPGPAQAFFGS